MSSLTIPQRIRAFFKARKAKADDNIERSEPETFLQNFQDWIFGMVIGASWMVIAYAFMTDWITLWIASVLTDMSGPFEHRLALLTSVFVIFAEVLVIFGVALNREPSLGDAVDVVNDLGEQIDERFAELEERVAKSISSVEKEIEDLDIEARLNPERK